MKEDLFEPIMKLTAYNKDIKRYSLCYSIHLRNNLGLVQGWATSQANSLILLKKTYFYPESSNKKCFVGQIGLEGLH